MSYKTKELSNVYDSRTWRRIWLHKKLGCPRCGVNSGCNKRSKCIERSWKHNRKTQWK